ncbi:MAG: hypothetical protein RLZZ292_851 [Bacteroidota bacterium]|jgi:hypothetical protein
MRLLIILLSLFVAVQVSSAQCSLACSNNVQVSLAANGQAVLVPQDMLLSAINCTGTLTLQLFDTTGVGMNVAPIVANTLKCSNISHNILAKVKDSNSNNFCWGTLKVEDKLAPTLQVQEVTRYCNEINTTSPTLVSDNCSIKTLVFADTLSDFPCGTLNPNGVEVVAKITRKWTATDASNNITTKLQTIWIRRAHLSDVVFPSDKELTCQDNPNNLSLTGQPIIAGNLVTANNGNSCNILVYKSDQILPTCAPIGKRILRTWTVTDWCTNQVTTKVQTIEIKDNTPPVFPAINDITVGTQATGCYGKVTIPTVVATDNCYPPIVSASWQYGNGFGPFQNVPQGTYIVTYKATDICGNTATKTMNLTVKDDDAPVAVCDGSKQIILGATGIVTMLAANFDKGSYDNCGIATILVSKDSVNFTTLIDFDCADLAYGTRTIVFKVTDNVGLENVCYSTLIFLDNTPPVLSCPSNKTLTCVQDYTNLALTGTALATDNCSNPPYITHTDKATISACGVGTVLRTWLAQDTKSNTATCVQTITMQDATPIVVDFPQDYTSNGCNNATMPSVAGQPTVTGDDCETIVVTHTDQTVTVAGTCLKILRHWDIVNLCVYNPQNNPNAGHWEQTQTINIIDNTAPVLTVPANVTVGAAQSCAAAVTLANATATDCSATIKITNNATTANNSGANASGIYFIGEHIVTFKAEDACGNTSTATMKITVIDNQAPTAVCATGVAVTLAADKTINITPVMIDQGKSSDNCAPNAKLTFTVTPNKFDCSQLGNQIVTLKATDLSNNTATCSATIVVQDLGFACGNPGEANLAGAIKTEGGLALSNVTLTLDDTIKVKTDTTGKFMFHKVQMKKMCKITPTSNEKPTAGVTTLDLVLMRKHILGIDSIKNPYRLIAADVNKSGFVSTFDMVQLRQLILNVTTTLPNNDSWRFVDAGYKFLNPSNPFQSAFPESMTVALDSNKLNANFVAIKIGDINGSVKPVAAPRNGDNSLALEIENIELQAGQTYRVPVRATHFQSLVGYQFGLQFDTDKIQLEPIAESDLPNYSQANFGESNLENGILTTSWDDASLKGTTFDEKSLHQTLFYLSIKAKQSVPLNDALALFLNSERFPAEAYDATEQPLPITLAYPSMNKANYIFLQQNYPNPFGITTTILFQLPEDDVVRLEVTDMTGRIVHTQTGNFKRGEHEFTVSKADLGVAGIYSYTIYTNYTSKYFSRYTSNKLLTQKMILSQ